MVKLWIIVRWCYVQKFWNCKTLKVLTIYELRKSSQNIQNTKIVSVTKITRYIWVVAIIVIKLITVLKKCVNFSQNMGVNGVMKVHCY